ncbi:cell wall-associated hydrolase (invasion-associated protein) [Paenibacillus sp. FSL R7-277]|uniref:C40 family peptidase n=1 Tax=unclassified Paenibacillus TaxID=185978 RepID=UPI0003E25F76|nr:C40 family peptidase [Paenibacillus sp. FSL R7-277]ETT74202.1 cell wall-associated hydrolase (invasion-associated protein) [Paenibacillus sp. FSL R7-277]OMF85042.1 hydrolase [Paenibacillus sp. FSL R7-0333]
MKKKLAAAVLSLSIIFTIGAGSAFADSKMDKVIDKAIGTKYVSGGTSTNGFDCSGFTMYVFDKIGINLPHQSGSQYQMGTAVSRDEMRPGDLVFFNTSGKGISHVGIYVGDGEFAHASSSRGVTISSLSDSYYVNRYVGAKRIMSTDAYKTVASDSQDNDDVQ